MWKMQQGHHSTCDFLVEISWTIWGGKKKKKMKKVLLLYDLERCWWVGHWLFGKHKKSVTQSQVWLSYSKWPALLGKNYPLFWATFILWHSSVFSLVELNLKGGFLHKCAAACSLVNSLYGHCFLRSSFEQWSSFIHFFPSALCLFLPVQTEKDLQHPGTVTHAARTWLWQVNVDTPLIVYTSQGSNVGIMTRVQLYYL